MPVLGMAQDTGTVVRWLVAEGQRVEEGQPLLEVETDKAIVEVPAMATGVLSGVTAAEGDEVPTGTVIAVLLGEGEAGADSSGASASEPVAEAVPVAEATPVAPWAPTPEAPAHATSSAARRPTPASAPSQAAPPVASRPVQRGGSAASAPAVLAAPNGRPLASPKARRLAKELSLDLRSVAGSGPGGAVRAVDIAALLRPGAAGAAPAAGGSASPQATWLRRAVGLAGLNDAVARANAHLARQRRPGSIASCDVLARLTLAALSAVGAPRPAALSVVRGTPEGALEPAVLSAAASSSLVGLAAERAAPESRADAEVQVLDLSEMPHESPLPPLPAGCRLRVTLAFTPGGGDGRGSLTLEHRQDPVADPTELLARLTELVEDPVGALLYA